MMLRDQFERDGFVVVERALGPDLIEQALDEVHSFKNTNLDWFQENQLLVGGCLSRVVNLHLLLPSLRPLFSQLPDALFDLLDFEQPSLYTSIYFERGSEQELHRDTPYFWTDPPYSYAGVWVALEDADESNGGLTVVPGSHRIGEPDRDGLRRSVLGDMECPSSYTPLFDAYNNWVRYRAEELGLVRRSVAVRKGDAIVWNASTLHGGLSLAGRECTRNSFVMHLATKDISVNHMQYFFHPERQVPRRPAWGYLVEGGRSFAAHGSISFMHKVDCELASFDSGFRRVGGAAG